MNIIDFPEWMQAVYGFTKTDIKINPEQGRHNQKTPNGARLWRERGFGEQSGWEFMPVAIGGVQLWNPIMRITGRKTVTETQMVEIGGTVKETISLDDYIINIRGIIKNTSGLWPDFEIQELANLYRVNEAVPIESAKTAILMSGNENVVITSLILPENPGKTQSALYEIECVSDIKFDLE